MFRNPDPSDLMWARARELMAQAERMRHQFFHLAATARREASWEPPADVFEDEREVVVVIALPGVPEERVEVTREDGVLVVRAERTLPLANGRHVVRQLEIPYGVFERRIRLPGVRLDAAHQQLVDGCIVLRLRKLI